MYRKARRVAHTIYRKNIDDLLALLLGRYPEFVYRRVKSLGRGDIPIFVFHSVMPDLFEKGVAFLSANGYSTLSGDELWDVLLGKVSAPQNAVVLTFDDARGSLWSTAFPILKKYGQKAVCFIVSNWIEDSNDGNPTLEEYWKGKADLSEIEQRDLIRPLCTWKEIISMHQSGTIEFQSHTSYHHSVFTSSRLIDFINPDFTPSFLNSDFNPVVRLNGEDQFLDGWRWGLPVYEYAPAMAAKVRYIESDRLNVACAEWVAANGAKAFFRKRGWRRDLVSFFRERAGSDGVGQRYQTAAERFREMKEDLRNSKRTIEHRLDKPVRHLCFPWYAGSEMAVSAAKEAGFACIYWGVTGRCMVNRVGQSIDFLNRMNEEYLFTLPGRNRVSLPQLLARKAASLVHKRRYSAGGESHSQEENGGIGDASRRNHEPAGEHKAE